MNKKPSWFVNTVKSMLTNKRFWQKGWKNGRI